MMRYILILLFLVILPKADAQIKEDLNYHYRNDFYYDSVLYKSKWEDYIRIEDNKIFHGQYQSIAQLEWLNTELDSIDSIDINKSQEDLGEPYRLNIRNDTVYIHFVYNYSNSDTLVPFYPLRKTDTLQHVPELSSIQSGNSSKWIYRLGKHIYKSDTSLFLLGQNFDCYLIKHQESSLAADKYDDVTKLIYVDKKSLIPLKIEWTYNISQTNQPRSYHKVTYLDSISNAIEPYEKIQEKITWEDTSKIWTEEQRIKFKKDCLNWTSEPTCDCIISRLNGSINFYKIQMPSSLSSAYVGYIRSTIKMCEEK